jgi:hypothetical protein
MCEQRSLQRQGNQLNRQFGMGVKKSLFNFSSMSHTHTTSILAKNEINSIINKLTLWRQDRSVGAVMVYKLDGQGSIPSPVGSAGSLPGV